MPDVLLYAPALIADNRAIGREVALTERARATAGTPPTGRCSRSTRDRRVAGRRDWPICVAIFRRARATCCACCDRRAICARHASDLARRARALDRRRARVALPPATTRPSPDRRRAAGARHGAAPCRSATRSTLDGVAVDVRMESWLAVGHDPPHGLRPRRRRPTAHADRRTRRQLRGVRRARPRRCGPAYASNIFAPQPRYLIDIARRLRCVDPCTRLRLEHAMRRDVLWLAMLCDAGRAGA